MFQYQISATSVDTVLRAEVLCAVVENIAFRRALSCCPNGLNDFISEVYGLRTVFAPLVLLHYKERFFDIILEEGATCQNTYTRVSEWLFASVDNLSRYSSISSSCWFFVLTSSDGVFVFPCKSFIGDSFVLMFTTYSRSPSRFPLKRGYLLFMRFDF